MIKTVFIQDKWAINKTLTTNEYLSYLGLSMLLRKNLIEHYVNSHYLAYLLSGLYHVDSKLTNAICNGVDGLAEKNLITIVHKNNKNDEWIINLAQLKKENWISKDNSNKKFYSAIDEMDIHKILNYNKNYYTKSISLVKFYSYLLSTLSKTNGTNWTKGVGFTSIGEMSDTICHSTKTVSQYLKQLEEMKLIFIYRSKDMIKYSSGEINMITHTYGKYTDKEVIIKAGREHDANYGHNTKKEMKRIKKDVGDKTRGYSQMYSTIRKRLDKGENIPYDYDLCKDIYFAMVEFNKRYEKEKPDRLKKLSIFSEYDFYNDD